MRVTLERLQSELAEVIKHSSFSIMDGKFAYLRTDTMPKDTRHFMIAQDDDEITIITREEKIDGLMFVERIQESFSLIAINVPASFYVMGLLAVLGGVMSEEGISLEFVSTFSRDYIIVKYELRNKVRDELIKLGFTEAE